MLSPARDGAVTRTLTARRCGDAHPHCETSQIHGFRRIWHQKMPGILRQRSAPRERRHARRDKSDLTRWTAANK